jgi:hypothetical protein
MLSFFKTFLKLGVPFGIWMGIWFWFLHDWQRAIKSALVCGFLFGLFMALFIEIKSRKFTQNRPLSTDEKLIKEGAANHFLNGVAVGGWIYLTDKRLYFKSHNLNFQNHELPIPLEQIVKAEKSNTFGIIPNKLLLTLRNGTTEKFVVSGVKQWVENLEKLI